MVENRVEPDCVKDGSYDNVIYCTVCNEELKRETVVLPALGHIEVYDWGTIVTCTTPGLTYGIHCERCGEILLAQQTVPALGHDVAVDEAVEPTCTDTGLTRGEHCVRCGEVLIAQQIVPALGHKPGDEVIENYVDATFYAAGSYDVVVYCTVCNAELSRVHHVIDQLDYEASIFTPNGEVRYATLQDAISAAQNGDTVVVARDIVLDHNDVTNSRDGNTVLLNVVDKEIALDLNGKTVEVDVTEMEGRGLGAVVYVDGNADLTVLDSTDSDGALIANESRDDGFFITYLFWSAQSNSYITIENGTYELTSEDKNGVIAYAMYSDTIVIKNGNFTQNTLNTIKMFDVDKVRAGVITIEAGTFNMNLRLDHEHESYVPNDRAVVQLDDGSYSIAEANVYLILNCRHEFGFVAKANDHASFVEKIVLVNDVTETADIEIYEIEIDLNGYILELATLETYPPKGAPEVTINDTVGTGRFICGSVKLYGLLEINADADITVTMMANGDDVKNNCVVINGKCMVGQDGMLKNDITVDGVYETVAISDGRVLYADGIFALTDDYSVDASETLTLSDNTVLTIAIGKKLDVYGTLVNNGKIIVYGTLNVYGALNGDNLEYKVIDEEVNSTHYYGYYTRFSPQISLGGDISVNFYVIKNDGWDTLLENGNLMLVAYLNGNVYEIPYDFKEYNVSGYRCAMFKLSVGPHLMNSPIKLQLVTENSEGEWTVASVLTENYTVKDTCQTYLNPAMGLSLAQRELVSALLRYGAQSQLYKGETDETKLATYGVTGMTEESTAMPQKSDDWSWSDDYVAGYVKSIKANIYFTDTIKITFTVKLADNVKVDIVAVDEDGIDMLESVVDNGDGTYTVTTVGIYAYDFNNKISLKVLSDGVQVDGMNYSVNSYAYIRETTDSTYELAMALYRYGVAAEALYAGK